METHMGQKKIDQTASQKYLGIFLEENGKNKATIANKTNKAIGNNRNIMNKISQLNLGKFHFTVAIFIKNSVLISSLMYATEALNNLDEDDITNHQIKLLFANGMGWGLRGSSEHANLKISNVAQGELEERHEYAGMKWFGYDNLIDKSCKLSTTNSWVRDYKVMIKSIIFF